MTARLACLDCGGIAMRGGSRCYLCTRAYDARRRQSPRLRGYDAEYRRERARVLAEEPWCHTRPRCPYPDSGTAANPLTGGHTVPLSLGGYGSPLVPLCRSCNSSQSNRIPVVVGGASASKDRLARGVPRLIRTHHAAIAVYRGTAIREALIAS